MTPSLPKHAHFPSLPARPARPGRPVRVCIATIEFVGPVRNGGIGTAYTSLAEALTRAGHEVTVLLVPRPGVDLESADRWVSHYAQRGIKLVPLPECDVPLEAPPHRARAYTTYRWLRERDRLFGVVHFAECLGVGYYAMLAKRAGLAFTETCLCVGTHGSTFWCRQVNDEPLDGVAELELNFMEQRSTALADVVIGPSQYLLNWKLRHGWRLPEKTFVQPYVMPRAARGDRTGIDDRRARAIEEIVFFGRLEQRKGLVPFCDALDRLARDRPKDFRVTFLGRWGYVGGQRGTDYVRSRAGAWPFAWQILDDLDQPEALAYLKRGNRLAVMPSLADNLPNTVLECLGAAIPFVAARAGGIPEMVAPEDRDRVLAPPTADALADRLGRVLRDGAEPAASAVDQAANEKTWIDWHAGFAETEPPSEPAGRIAALPKVRVCLSQGESPPWLEAAEPPYPDLDVMPIEAGEPLPEPAGGYLLFVEPGVVPRAGAIRTLVEAVERLGCDAAATPVDLVDDPGGSEPVRARRLPLGGAMGAGVFENCFAEGAFLVRPEALAGASVFRDHWDLLAHVLAAGRRLEVIPESLFSRPPVGRPSPVAPPSVLTAGLPLGDVAVLARGLLRRRAEDRRRIEELRRYEFSYRHFMNRPGVRVFRGIRRVLRRLAGKPDAPSSRGHDEQR